MEKQRLDRNISHLTWKTKPEFVNVVERQDSFGEFYSASVEFE